MKVFLHANNGVIIDVLPLKTLFGSHVRCRVSHGTKFEGDSVERQTEVGWFFFNIAGSGLYLVNVRELRSH